MESIEKIGVIDRSKLNEEFYFKSLLKEAYRNNLLNEEEIERIQFECIDLLAYKTERYNSGDSSSIRVETAENIMISNLYTIGIWLKSFPCADDAVKALKETNISGLYANGRNRIETKLKAARHIYSLTIQNKIDTENYTYGATVVDGIKGFFKIYNPDYEAHEIRITADYPLCIPVENLVGIEFIQKYLESIYYENIFCNYFSYDDIHHLLCGYDKGYSDLIINIFEHVLTDAIGCKLAGIDALGLNISDTQIDFLQNALSQKSNGEIEKMIMNANKDLQEELSITNTSLQQYIRKSLPSIISNIYHMVKENTLHKVFIVPKYPELNSKLYFSFGAKMDDKQYRNIVEEIMQCRFLSDKMLIIKSKIRSLADLEDLLFDAELSVHEITTVLKELEIAEIAALAKRHPFKPDIEGVDLSEVEQEFRLCLHNYIIVQPLERKNLILKTIDLLDDCQQ